MPADVYDKSPDLKTLQVATAGNGVPPTNPPFNARIHCESSPAAILCQLHGQGGLDSDAQAELRNFFQVSPSSHSSSFTP
jgi:hypothetical protein